ncbi:hypothetical protein ACEUZ9_002892 [Paracoccus litorisediminis]|uniref:hypothetical protein n=1 Tax=Paracoccus litorisediminis TaxID=2006130 RepID=UPI00373253E6
MSKVTSADFQKNFGTYKREALRHPVTIMIHGKETLVIMSKTEFDRLNSGEAATIQRAIEGDPERPIPAPPPSVATSIPATEVEPPQDGAPPTQPRRQHTVTENDMARINAMMGGTRVTYRQAGPA